MLKSFEKRISVLLSIVFLVSSMSLHGQASEMAFYYPDGTPYKRACRGISDINADFDTLARVKVFAPLCFDSVDLDCFVVVGFKLLTDEPLWVWTNNSRAISESVRAFNFQVYVKEGGLIRDLDNHVSKRSLTYDFLIETLGPPDEFAEYEQEGVIYQTIEYRAINLVLSLKDGAVISFSSL